MYSPLRYMERPVSTMVQRMKYRNAKEYGEILATLLNSALTRYSISPPKNSVVVAVPLHPLRERARGFNQAEVMARIYAERSKLPLASAEALVRTKNTPPQAKEEKRNERFENIRDAFYVRDATDVFGRTAILIDDVATTGATINEATAALKRGGAKAVWVFTAAR